MQLDNLSAQINFFLSYVLITYSMIFFNSLQCMRGDVLSPKDQTRWAQHLRLQQAIRENSLAAILGYIANSDTLDQSIKVEAPAGEPTYIEFALTCHNEAQQAILPATAEEQASRAKLIDKLIYNGFPLPNEENVKAQLRNALAGRKKALAILDTSAQLETNIRQTPQELILVNVLAQYAAAQRRSDLLETLICYGARPEVAARRLGNLRKLPIFNRNTQRAYKELMHNMLDRAAQLNGHLSQNTQESALLYREILKLEIKTQKSFGEINSLYLKSTNEAQKLTLAQKAWTLDSTGNTLYMGRRTDQDATIKLRLIVASLDASQVWGLGSIQQPEHGGKEIYYRTGVNPENPAGFGWVQIPGRLEQIVVLSNKIVWGLNSLGHLYVTSDNTDSNPQGTPWQSVPGAFGVVTKELTLDGDSLIAISIDGKRYRRVGITLDTTTGTSWQLIN